MFIFVVLYKIRDEFGILNFLRSFVKKYQCFIFRSQYRKIFFTG